MPRLPWLSLLVAVLVVATSAPANAQTLPDVRPSPPFDVRVVQREGRWYLGFAMEVRNVGPAALRLQGQGDGSGVMLARQVTEDGSQVLNPAVGTFRFVWGPTHHHWHYMEFMRYRMRGIDRPRALRDQKQGFCLAEAPFVTGWCAPEGPTLTTTELGLRPGGVDVYGPHVEGQEIAIDPVTAPAGRYALTARIGPTHVLRETRIRNNVSSTVIDLDWLGGTPRLAAPIDSCVGAGCRKAPPPRGAATARALARRALRRTFRRFAARRGRLRCREWRQRAHACRVRLHGFRGRVRVWYVVRPSGTRWYYSLRGVRACRDGGSRCSRRIRRVRRPGGRVAAVKAVSAGRAGAASLVCRLAR
jgi:hypothetical protein